MTAVAADFATEGTALSFDDVYAEHVAFVWRVLRSLGVPDAQLEDAAQDVFVVVHRRLREFEGRSAITTWLFTITRKVAANHRRKAAPAIVPVMPVMSGDDPFKRTAKVEAAAMVARILDAMDDDKRIVFALVELEATSVAEVARMLGINPNTASSRLRLARAEFAAAVVREKAKSHE